MGFRVEGLRRVAVSVQGFVGSRVEGEGCRDYGFGITVNSVWCGVSGVPSVRWLNFFFNPFRVSGQIRAVVGGCGVGVVSEVTVGPLVGELVELAVQLAHGDALRVQCVPVHLRRARI